MDEPLFIKSENELILDIDSFIETVKKYQWSRVEETTKNSELPQQEKMDAIVRILKEKTPTKDEILKCLCKYVIFQNQIYSFPELPINQNVNAKLDPVFLHDVNIFNPSMSSIADRLLTEIRKFYPQGQLKKESIHHFVESPENFWSVWNQVNNHDLKISIYGTPFYYETPLTLTQYDISYSTFYITNERELAEGILLIRQALERKEKFER